MYYAREHRMCRLVLVVAVVGAFAAMTASSALAHWCLSDDFTDDGMDGWTVTKCGGSNQEWAHGDPGYYAELIAETDGESSDACSTAAHDTSLDGADHAAGLTLTTPVYPPRSWHVMLHVRKTAGTYYAGRLSYNQSTGAYGMQIRKYILGMGWATLASQSLGTNLTPSFHMWIGVCTDVQEEEPDVCVRLRFEVVCGPAARRVLTATDEIELIMAGVGVGFHGWIEGNSGSAMSLKVDDFRANCPPEVGTVSDVDESWDTVTFDSDFNTTPVVVCTPQLAHTALPVVTRVKDVTTSSFKVRLQNPSASYPDTDVQSEVVHYLAMEEGTWILPDAREIEAGTVESDDTNYSGSWGTASMESYSYDSVHMYNPVVLGQVMTYNDSDWSVFWARASSAAGDPPTVTACLVGKHVGEDTDQDREDETLGVVVVEECCVVYDVPEDEEWYMGASDVGADSVQGVGNNPPYTYTCCGGQEAWLLANPTVCILSTAGMNGGDGCWPVLYGSDPFDGCDFDLAVDEDQISDSERLHCTEQVAFAAW
jgi:hypothetical protein